MKSLRSNLPLILVVSGLVTVVVGCSLFGRRSTAQPTFNYLYKRPAGLPPAPAALPLAVPAPTHDDALQRGSDRALALASALGVQFDREKIERQVDRSGETLRLRQGNHRLKVYIHSGMVTFRNTALYNGPADSPDTPRITKERASQLAREVCRSLATAKLLDESELLLTDPRIAFRMASDARGARNGERGRGPRPAGTVQDARVFIARTIERLGVSGEGIRLVFSNRGELAGLDFYWRDLRVDPKSRSVVKLDMNAAKRRFEASAPIPNDAIVDVHVNELVYFDPSRRDPVGYLEPAYLFVYVARVPTRDGVFRVSKKLHFVVPAIAHDRQQVPSPRRARLAKLQRELRTDKRSGTPTPINRGQEDERAGR